MRSCFILLLIGFISSGVFSQVNAPKSIVGSLFKLQTDSIERKITRSNWGTDTTYYLHYTVTNISTDTLTYITNSCFYYNHYSLKAGKFEFDLNSTGGCSFNAMTPHTIDPGESFHQSEWIIATNMHVLTKGEWNTTLSVPLVKHDEKTYRVDGRALAENNEFLTFTAQTKVMETRINNKKRKKTD